jgi:chemotaxis protein MotA
MEKGSLIGLVLVIIGVFVGLILKGADPVALFTNVAALLIVLVGSIGAVMLSYSGKRT